jgi:hypothetical protein
MSGDEELADRVGSMNLSDVDINDVDISDSLVSYIGPSSVVPAQKQI